MPIASHFCYKHTETIICIGKYDFVRWSDTFDPTLYKTTELSYRVLYGYISSESPTSAV